MPVMWALFYLVIAAFLLEECFLIKPVSTIDRSDPRSKTLEHLAIWIPALGIGVMAMSAETLGGLRWSGILNVAGLLLCLLGLALRFWSRRTLGRFFTIGVVKQEGHRVVRCGPYRLVRHPAYLGFMVFYLGFPLVLGNWWGFLMLTVPAWVIFVILIRVEDQKLVEILGDDYRAYQQNSARLIPGVW